MIKGVRRLTPRLSILYGIHYVSGAIRRTQSNNNYVVNNRFKPIMVINMKYIIGSLIISFGIIFVAVVVLMSLNVQAPESVMKYLGLAWALLAIITYPLAKKLIRN